MKYFKNTNNEIFAYDDEQISQGYGADLTPITETEKAEILAPSPAQLKESRVSEIKARLLIIDQESIRPLRAIAAGTQTDFDTKKINDLETERAALVAEMVQLNG